MAGALWCVQTRGWVELGVGNDLWQPGLLPGWQAVHFASLCMALGAAELPSEIGRQPGLEGLALVRSLLRPNSFPCLCW